MSVERIQRTKNKNKERANELEKQVSDKLNAIQTPNSGAGKLLKGDQYDETFLYETKSTEDTKLFVDWFKKINKQAKEMNRIPCVIFIYSEAYAIFPVIVKNKPIYKIIEPNRKSFSVKANTLVRLQKVSTISDFWLVMLFDEFVKLRQKK